MTDLEQIQKKLAGEEIAPPGMRLRHRRQSKIPHWASGRAAYYRQGPSALAMCRRCRRVSEWVLPGGGYCSGHAIDEVFGFLWSPA